jgi:hypothetical protein
MITNNILSLSGPDLSERRQLYDFVVEQLNKRKVLCPHQIGEVCRMLENHRDNLLAFAGALDDKFDEIAGQFSMPVFLNMPCVYWKDWIETMLFIGSAERLLRTNSRINLILSK